MKKNLISAVISCYVNVLILLAFSAFFSLNISGAQEVRNLDKFDRISLSLGVKVYIVQGTECKLEIQADEEDLDKIETTVKDGKLEIKSKSWTTNLRGDVIIHITMPELRGLSVSGSGNIIADSGFKCQHLELSVTGSGAIKMKDLAAQTIEALITGSGNIMLNGEKTAEELKLTITGSGNYSAENVKVNEAMVKITGSGSAKINVAEELKTNITGSGSVLYRGDPLVNANSTGSGRTKKM